MLQTVMKRVIDYQVVMALLMPRVFSIDYTTAGQRGLKYMSSVDLPNARRLL